jgi:hypothetical protein
MHFKDNIFHFNQITSVPDVAHATIKSNTIFPQKKILVAQKTIILLSCFLLLNIMLNEKITCHRINRKCLSKCLRILRSNVVITDFQRLSDEKLIFHLLNFSTEKNLLCTQKVDKSPAVCTLSTLKLTIVTQN